MTESVYNIIGKDYLSNIKGLNTQVNNYICSEGLKALRVGKLLQYNGVTDMRLLKGVGGNPLIDEISEYRHKMLRLTKHSEMMKDVLFVDYLLASFLCYVEYDKDGKVEKYLATRNRHIVGGLTGKSDEETKEYTNHLTTFETMYVMNQLKVLKINKTKKGYTVTKMKGLIDVNSSLKVTPVCLLEGYANIITQSLKSGMYSLTYTKDNTYDREGVYTLDRKVLIQYYDSDFVDRMLKNSEIRIDRGYIRVPELGISKYDYTGVRAVNIGRVTSISKVETFDKSFIDVDFSTIQKTFIDTILDIDNITTLSVIYSELVGSDLNSDDIMEFKNRLMGTIESKCAIGTTTYLKELYLYMQTKGDLFKKTVEVYDSSDFLLDIDNFNLGLDL